MTREPALDGLAQSVVACHAAPAAVCATAFRAQNGWNIGVGCAGTLWPSAPTPASPDTVFDLASLTKPIVAIAAATEFTRNHLNLQTSLGTAMPELRDRFAANKTLEELLSHRAGLVAHLPLYQPLQSGRPWSLRRAMKLAAGARAEVSTENSRAIYSDLGYILAGAAIERQVAMPLDEWLSQQLGGYMCRQIGSSRQWLGWKREFKRQCAPTESVRWRGGLIQGLVHDENAWAIGGGGVAGHAGLFGTATAVVQLGAALLDSLDGRRDRLELSQSAVELVTRRRPGGTLCMGVDRKSADGSTAGSLASKEAFGHLGFTGTSFWCDPARAITTVVLSNRVCPTRDNITLRAMRPVLHDGLFEWALRRRSGR